MKNFFNKLFIPARFFFAGGSIVLLFIVGFIFPVFFIISKIVLLFFIAVLFAEIFFLFRDEIRVSCVRNVPHVLSLSDENKISLNFTNECGYTLRIQAYEELPWQFQERKFQIYLILEPNGKKTIDYKLRPLTRGEYSFGNTLSYVSTRIGFVEKKIEINNSTSVAVFPSVMQMKNMELRAFSSVSQFRGIRKHHRIGHSYEFEQIKNYVQGDDYRSINWKATGKRGSLMVNQYDDERAQQIYFIIDKSRRMRMPFNNLSLLDYAINTTLSIANITLRKQDRAGLITFSSKVNTVIKAEKNNAQLRKILGQLYREKENTNESNYELLYTAVRNLITVRSLLVLFTNFESMYAMERVLPILRKLNKAHLLLVVFFENSEVVNYSNEDSKDLREIYYRVTASKLIDEKNQIIYNLKLFGIQAIQTAPENLTVNVLNKYLELKARGMI